MEFGDVSEEIEDTQGRGLWNRQIMAGAVMKRFAWLWGSLLGVVILPLLAEICSSVTYYYLPHSHFSLSHRSVEFSYFNSLQNLVKITRYDGVCDAGIGCCGAMLCVGYRTWKWRLPSILGGLGTMSYLSWDLWEYWHCYVGAAIDWDRWNHWV
ncbi:hypothetical protein EON83_12695 [bacterium]|nr:MAG: hypothetical protein EON83_12695 [bacterium]